MAHRFRTLDGMRGVAALAVLYLHASELILNVKASTGYLSVDFFFLLSGFVLAEAYGPKLAQGWSAFDFLARRVVRLYPMILAGGALGLCDLIGRQLLDHDLGWGNIAIVTVSNLLLVPSSALSHFRLWGFSLNNPFWSLSCEFVVNIFFGLIAFRLRNSILLIILGLSAAALIALSIHGHGIETGFYFQSYGLGLVRAFFPFFAGVAISRFCKPRPVKRLWDLPVVVILAIFLMTRLAQFGDYEWVTVVLIFPALVVLGAFSSPMKGMAPVWEALGELSYPLYAVHYPILVAAAEIARRLHLSGGRLVIFAGLVGVICIAVAAVTLLMFDRPVRRRIEERRRMRSPAAEEGAPSRPPLAHPGRPGALTGS